MWSDNETEIDLLDFSYLVEAVTTIVANDRLLPSTIGVYGDWGSGKSSLLRMVQKTMEDEDDILCLSFNGWLFEGYENAKTALMGAILDEIGKKRGEAVKVTGVFKKLVKRVDVLKLSGWAAKHGIAYAAAGHWGLTATAGVDAWNWLKSFAEKGKDIKADDLKEFIKEAPESEEDLRRTVIEFRDDFEKLLEETKLRRLVVMIDDLDRCNPETVIETLEAIKLFLFVPSTVFVLGADERLIKYAVRRRFPEFPGGERAEVGRDYLEKLIQFPVRVPPLGRPEMETYIALLFAEISTLTPEQREQARMQAVRRDASQINEVTFNLKVAEELFGADKLPDDLAESLRLGEQLAKVLTIGLNGNPRQVKRFLNTLLMRISMAKSRGIELKKRVLAKLMLLEYFKPEFFKVLASAQVQENGRPKLIEQLEAALSQSTADRRNGAAIPPVAPVKAKAPPVAEEPLSTGTGEIDLNAWLNDPWMHDWLENEPLRGIDLRPYYFFSRDSLGPLGGAVQRLTPKAQEALAKLLDASEAVRKVGLQRVTELNPAESAAIFEALADKVQNEEDLSDENSSFAVLFELAKARPELFGQLAALLSRLPEVSLPLSATMRLLSAAQGPANKTQAEQILRHWQSSGNQRLAASATNALKRANRPTPLGTRAPGAG